MLTDEVLKRRAKRFYLELLDRLVMASDSVELESRISQLEEELEETRNNLFKAAECGNSLLSTNQLLNEKLETLEKEHVEQLEVN